eukprot:251946-Lingulodinium_polyedra.AAC.1
MRGAFTGEVVYDDERLATHSAVAVEVRANGSLPPVPRLAAQRQRLGPRIARARRRPCLGGAQPGLRA